MLKERDSVRRRRNPREPPHPTGESGKRRVDGDGRRRERDKTVRPFGTACLGPHGHNAVRPHELTDAGHMLDVASGLGRRNRLLTLRGSGTARGRCPLAPRGRRMVAAAVLTAAATAGLLAHRHRTGRLGVSGRAAAAHRGHASDERHDGRQPGGGRSDCSPDRTHSALQQNIIPCRSSAGNPNSERPPLLVALLDGPAHEPTRGRFTSSASRATREETCAGTLRDALAALRSGSSRGAASAYCMRRAVSRRQGLEVYPLGVYNASGRIFGNCSEKAPTWRAESETA
jgi:hypothetical protein